MWSKQNHFSFSEARKSECHINVRLAVLDYGMKIIMHLHLSFSHIEVRNQMKRAVL
uniref:Uncharacterized protein n=1 Tax=Rhizophora mucronata TaxID=61149 RepID=A0A2P2PJ12_RHIMU